MRLAFLVFVREISLGVPICLMSILYLLYMLSFICFISLPFIWVYLPFRWSDDYLIVRPVQGYFPLALGSKQGEGGGDSVVE